MTFNFYTLAMASNTAVSHSIRTTAPTFGARKNQAVEAFVTAAAKGELAAVKAALRGRKALLNAKNSEGETALYTAAKACRPNIVKFLIAAKADLNLPDSDGCTPLFAAVEKEKSTQTQLQVVQALVAAKAELDHPTNIGGMTPLSTATCRDNLAVFNCLMDAGANINLPKHCSPVYEAACLGRIDILKRLISAGADLNQPESSMVRVPMKAAITHGHTEAAKLLIAAGADVNREDRDGVGPLYSAIFYRRKDVVEALLKKNPQLNPTSGMLPLHAAIANNDTATVKKLLKAGANPQAISRSKFNAAELAESYGHTHLIKLFQK